MKRMIFIIMAASLLLAGCLPGMYDALSQPIEDPYIETPKVESFIESNTIIISWKEDENAHEYILERAQDKFTPTPVFEEIYRGVDNIYRDTGLADDSMYFYRLYKRRGQKTFPLSKEVMGVSSLIIRDEHEPNNSQEEATELGAHTLHGNIHFYQAYYKGYKLIDEDWYYIDIPPQWQATMIIHDEEVPGGESKTHFKIYIKDRDTKDVTQDNPISIGNFSEKPYRCYFKVYPNESIYLSELVPYGTGGSTTGYTIKLTRMQVGAE
ncbi:MAG: hypothetical protein FWH35_00855 [Treponema sp.]|nr:hypothetical protein [Treponema sp.]